MILLFDARRGRKIIRPAGTDPVYQFSNDCSQLPRADAVLFHVPTARHPRRVRKYPGQKWVAYSLESDANYPQLRDPEYMAYFDFTMTYRWDSDGLARGYSPRQTDAWEALARPWRHRTEARRCP